MALVIIISCFPRITNIPPRFDAIIRLRDPPRCASLTPAGIRAEFNVMRAWVIASKRICWPQSPDHGAKKHPIRYVQGLTPLTGSGGNVKSIWKKLVG